MDTLKNKSMRCVVKMNNIRHFTLFTFGFFVGCNRVMSSFSVLWVYPFSILCRWRHYATILQWMACFLEAISKQPQCSEDASKVKERLAHIWISSSQLTTSLCQFGRHAKVGSTFHRRLSGRNFPPSSPFFILLFLRYGQINSMPPFNRLWPRGSLSGPLSAMMRTGFCRGRPPPSTWYPFRLWFFHGCNFGQQMLADGYRLAKWFHLAPVHNSQRMPSKTSLRPIRFGSSFKWALMFWWQGFKFQPLLASDKWFLFGPKKAPFDTKLDINPLDEQV